MQTATKIFLDALRAANSNAGTLKVFVDAFFTCQEHLALLEKDKNNISDAYSAGAYDGCVGDALAKYKGDVHYFDKTFNKGE